MELDTLECIGVVANVFRCLEVVSEIIRQGKCVGKRGFVEADFDSNATQLNTAIGKLSGQKSAPGTVATDCIGLAKDVLAKVTDMKRRKGRSTWRAIKVGVKPVNDTKQLEELENRVQVHTSQCEDLFTLIVRNAVTKAQDKLPAPDLQAILEAIKPLLSSSKISSSSLHELSSLTVELDHVRITAQQQAVLKMLKFPAVHERFDSITEVQARTFSWLLDAGFDTEAACLDDSFAQARALFIGWLKYGSGFFYISGKPGAGKSTLMKFICRHENFNHQLALWNPDLKHLVVGRFFFWMPGRPEQKSIHGLLRGLLYSILDSAPPFLAAIALPDFCEAVELGKSVVIDNIQVQHAFENILKGSAAHSYKVILLIDGLDEFEGDHADLLALLQSWTSKYPSSIKICVSSREYSIFEEFFALSPKLRLHELTRNDMSRLIRSRLQAVEFFASLSNEEQDKVEALISMRAEGVFLWVVMVVATIENGLVTGDIATTGELVGRIKDCPTDLDDLFPHLLNTVTVHFRAWAFRAITLVQFAQLELPELLQSQSSQSYPGVGLLDLMLLDETTPTWDMSAFQPRSEAKQEDIPTRLESARKKVLGRCNGFLNVAIIHTATAWPANGNGNERMYAALTHRSVVEFLRTEQAQGHMGRYLGGFDPFIGLCSTVLACLRFLSPSNYPLLKPKETWTTGAQQLSLADILDDSLQNRWTELIKCALALGKSGSPKFLNLLDALGDAIKRQLTIQLSLLRARLSPAGSSPHALLITLTLSHGIYEYSEWRRRQTAPGVDTPLTGLILPNAFQGMIRNFQIDGYGVVKKWNATNQDAGIRLDRLHHLLTEFCERGIDVNWVPTEEHDGAWKGSRTIEDVPWTCCQMMLWAMLTADMPPTSRHRELIDQLIRHGASLDMKILLITPLKLIHIMGLTPPDGWVLLVPYTRDTTLIDALLQGGVPAGRCDGMPVALIQETSPLYRQTRPKERCISLADLVVLYFPKDDVNTELLGSPRVICELGALLKEPMVVESAARD